MLSMVYCACLLCCSMNLDHCMYVFHASLLINCYHKFKIIEEMCSCCGMPILWEARYIIERGGGERKRGGRERKSVCVCERERESDIYK
jgi:hypothetical protein